MILWDANYVAFRLAKPACDHGPMSSYEPNAKDAALFAKHKQARKVIKDTRASVAEAAERAIRAGATNQQLAELTGMTDETFRKLAEKIGVDNRVKPPTVGKEVTAGVARAYGAAHPVASEHAPPQP